MEHYADTRRAAPYHMPMPTMDNEHKPQGPVRVGLVTDAAVGDALIAAVDACLMLQPLGLAGTAAPGSLADVPRFDDPRQLLSQPRLEAVLLASSTRSDLELAALATERGLHVWRPPPLAADFAAATEMVTQAKQSPTVHRVASWWEYVLDHVWHELDWPADFAPVYSDLRAAAPGPPADARQARAGQVAGGALAQAGYALLEALVALRGLPDLVVGAAARFRKGAGGGPRETEDAAAAILRYAGGGHAVVAAAWDLPPLEQQLVHHSPTATVMLTAEEVRLERVDRPAPERRPLPGDYLADELMRFAEVVRSGARERATLPLERHVAVSALLETIYLAARTGHPESPRKLYQVQGWPEPR